MNDVFEYEGKNVVIKCNNGDEYKGKVKWCARAEDIDEKEDVIAIGGTGILAGEIKSIKIVD